MGRRRLPPAPAMKSPISWIRPTGEASSRAMACSTASSSGPTAIATRSLSSASSEVGTFNGRNGQSPKDDAVFNLDLRSLGDALELDHRELLADLGDPARRHFLVQLAQQLARDRMDDRDLVAAHAHGAARPGAVGGGQIDH